MKVAILGGGFGLYGYLPALRSLSCKILLPNRYRAVIESRAELSGLAGEITWTENEEAALDLADAVVVARRPADQARLIGELLRKPNLERLLLEKPLATSPLVAAGLLDQIERSGKIMRMGYGFGFTGWGHSLIQAAPPPSDIRIRWQFRAHHYATDKSSWKRFEAEGGGALKFYGIQLINLLAKLGFDAVVSSSIASMRPNEAQGWHATLSNGGRTFCSLVLDSNSAQTCFAVDASQPGLSVSLTDPFGEANSIQDRRVPVLTSLCREFLTAEQTSLPSTRKTVALWQEIEDVTVRDKKAP
jgi:predicted dehydrogenase